MGLMARLEFHLWLSALTVAWAITFCLTLYLLGSHAMQLEELKEQITIQETHDHGHK